MIEILKEIGVIVGLPVLRSVAGWAQKALEDSKVTLFEWKLLFSTVVRVGVIGLATFYGLNEIGFDVSALGASLAAFLGDLVIGALKKK